MDIKEFFMENNRVAVAFSGGVDSTYLLYAAKENGCDIHAYFVDSAFQPRFEVDSAKALAETLGVPLTILETNVLGNEDVAKNGANRCYFCKHVVFGLIWQAAKADGHTVLLDGTNASDDSGDRPGMRATGELSVKSPLRECGLTKAEIRIRSKEAGLPTWDKPAYACLATRIPTGTKITAEALDKVEAAEEYLMGLGFADLRVRMLGTAAKLQVTESQIGKVFEMRERISEGLTPFFTDILVDLRTRCSD
jgi:pyridinium-3,5-biscarboxylic acid mononucleotide sulfurtransferase